MPKNSGRFDLEDVGWEKPREEDPLTKILIRSSPEVQNGAIIGFCVAAIVLALTVHRGFFVAAVAGLFLGLIGGAIVGKIVEIRRVQRRKARREAKGKKKSSANDD